MTKPLIDEIVLKIVDSFTDEMCYEYYNKVICKDLNFDQTKCELFGTPGRVTREVVFQYTYDQVWSSVHSKMTDEEVERIFLT